MPIKELVIAMGEKVPADIRRITNGLQYRDFITVGLLLNKLSIKNENKAKNEHDLIKDNWIYIQEPEVKIGRLQIFNNWSPYMVADKSKVWLGLEYLNKLTSFYNYNLRIVATTSNHTNLIEEYSGFRVGNLTDNFRLTLGKLVSGKNGYFSVYNNSNFSTFDFGNKNLANKYSSGFWHVVNKTYCFSCTDKLKLKISSTIVNLSFGRNVQVFITKMFLVLN